MELIEINSKVSKYIDTLHKNANNTETNHLKNLFSREDYDYLLSDITILLHKYPDKDLAFYRTRLLENSDLYSLLHSFIEDRKLTPGFVVTFGTELNKDTIVCGNKQEVLYENGHYVNSPIKMQENTIFDLASTSKLFTAIAILKLCEAGIIDMHEPVVKYAPQFTNLKDITIYDLLTFSVPVRSAARIDTASSVEEANKLVFTLEKEETHEPTFPYTDMGSIALKFVIENVTNMSLTDFIQEEIFNKCYMKRTFLNVPEDLTASVANENYSSIIGPDGKLITIYDNVPGTVHDAKTKALGHSLGIAPGHAGFFSCAQDLDNLALQIMNNKILTKQYTHMLGQNVVGKLVTNKTGDLVYNCHHGMLTYSKQASNEYLSVVRPFLSGKAFASPGFTGTCLCIDPLNKISTFIGTNRLHNRIYAYNATYKDQIKSNRYGCQEYVSPTGEHKVLSKAYSHSSAEITEITMKLALQYRLLETIFDQKQTIKLIKHI